MTAKENDYIQVEPMAPIPKRSGLWDSVDRRFTKVEKDIEFLSRLSYLLIALIVAIAGIFAFYLLSMPS